ncbi:MAG: class I SAM-dependent methyltransferase, partial [Desulfobacteraceae bacterium]
MPQEKRDFDKEAASWDENPARTRLAEDVAEALKKALPLSPAMDAMDFGCGTGLVTLRLQPLVRAITGIDSARGMLEILNRKIDHYKLDHVVTLLADLDKGDLLPGNFDLIVSSMTLHHVKDPA